MLPFLPLLLNLAHNASEAAPDVSEPIHEVASHVIPSHALATWLLSFVDGFLDMIGLKHHQTIEEIIYVAIIIAVAFLIGWAVRVFLLWGLRKLVKLRNSDFTRQLLEQRTMARCSHIIPPVVFMALVPFAFPPHSSLVVWMLRIGGIYATFAFGIGASAIMDFIFVRYNQHENQKNLPIRGVLNLAKGILWIILVILIISILVGRSPAVLLTGLGVFASALMLVFKDSILGFVAGIQMSQNDMLHVGDWIEVPGTPANGSVIDVTLSAVKVRNWDNTIVTVPPYTLVSTSFQNYRGMVDSGRRRITKTLTIDYPTVMPLNQTIINEAVAAYPALKSFVDKLRAEGKTEVNEGGITPVNGTLETNLGLFRAYCYLYLMGRDDISKEETILVRLLDPTNAGLQLQLYCFTTTTAWDAYEGIQSSVVEHITTAAPTFGLGIYSSGSMTVDMDQPEAQATPTSPAASAVAAPDKQA